jgi:hypothetical protein
MSQSSSNAVTQPIVRPITVTSTNQGDNSAATFTWESIPTSQTWVGTLSCPGAPYFAVFTVFNFADQIGFFRASNAFGPFYLPAGCQLSVQATGLFATSQFTMFFVGYVSTELEVPPVFPNAYADTVIATNQGGLAGTFVDATQSSNTTVLPALPSGFSYRLHSISFLGAGALATTNGVANLVDQGTNPSTIVFTKAYLSGQQIESSYLFNGLLCIGPVVITTATGFTDIFPHIRYDIIAL